MPEIKFPVEIKKISYGDNPAIRTEPSYSGKCGDLVAVRPCAEEHEGKTFLGILLGEVALSQMVTLSKEGELTVDRFIYNPAMFVPDLNEVIFGCGSWWGAIESEEQLKKITDDDISNVWYVKALEQLAKADAEGGEEPATEPDEGA